MPGGLALKGDGPDHRELLLFEAIAFGQVRGQGGRRKKLSLTFASILSEGAAIGLEDPGRDNMRRSLERGQSIFG